MTDSNDYISVTGYDDILSGSGLDAVDAGNVGLVTINTTGLSPVNNVVGQTWYDTSTGSLNVNTGSGYMNMGSVGVPNVASGYVLTNNTNNLTVGQASHIWNTTQAGNTMINSKLIIKHGGKEIDVGDAITMLMDRLCIIEPSLHLHEKYPALKEAYDAYKAIEAMCKAGDTDE
jgi:hypothetical protein